MKRQGHPPQRKEQKKSQKKKKKGKKERKKEPNEMEASNLSDIELKK